MIKTPQELLEFMSEFKYEWMDKNGNFHEEITPNAYEDYSLMTPEEVSKYKRGICVDQSEFERDWFSKNNYEHKVMVIQIEREDSRPGHEFLIYKENDKYYWFENAWYNERGIHEYNSYEELIEDIKHKFVIQNDISEQELNNIEIFEQIKYPYHLSYEEMDKYKYKEELKKILSIIEEKHIDMYFTISKEELNKYIEELLTKYELKDKYDLYYLANVIIKEIFGRYDSHTKLVWKNADFKLPIRLKYIDGKVYIIKTSDDNKDMLFGELLSINNIPLEQIIKEIDNTTAYSTNEFLYMQIENTLYNGIKLKSLPSIKTDSKSFVFEILKDGKVVKRKLTKSNEQLYQDKNYTYNIIDGVMHIIYSSCREKYEGQMLEFVRNISEESRKNNITKFVVDIRDNSGGNSEIIRPLIEFLRDKDVVTLTDKYVFSGGRFALYDLKKIGSITVGTGVGTTLNCFGNSCVNYIENFILPVSFKYFYYDEVKKAIINIRTKEEFMKFKNNHNNLIYFEPQIFEPDYYVENTIEDYRNKYDRQLYSALFLLNTRYKKIR